MRIKIVAHKCNWPSWPEKIKALQDWYRSKIDLQFDIEHIDLGPTIPFIKYEDGREGVDPSWYDTNVTWRGIGYEIVILVMEPQYWQSMKARGWRTDSDQGPIQLQMAAGEAETMVFPNFPSMSSFYQIARHEIMHALYMISGQFDMTHFWWDRGQFDYARDGLKIPANSSWPIIVRSINFLSFLVAKTLSKMSNSLPTPPQANRELLYKVAKDCIGMDASPSDNAPDELACIETVDSIYFKAFGRYINPDRKTPQTSTYRGYAELRAAKDIIEVDTPLPGDMILSPTGFGGKNGVLNGHIGIVGENGVVMSNQSVGVNKGQFQPNYTLETWRDRFEKKGGYPVKFYRVS